MKPQRGAQHLDEGPKVRVSRPDASAPAPVPTLSSEEVAVLECLQEAGTGLTLRQIGSRVSCEPDTLVQVVSVLVDGIWSSGSTPSFLLLFMEPQTYADIRRVPGVRD